MEALMSIAIGVLVATGTYMVLRARTFDVIIGLTLMSYAVNLFVFSMGGLRLDAAPLTAIVIGFAMTGFVVVLAIKGYVAQDSDHVDGRGGRQP